MQSLAADLVLAQADRVGVGSGVDGISSRGSGGSGAGSGMSGSCLAIAVRRSSSCCSKTNVVDMRSMLYRSLPFEIAVPFSVTSDAVSAGKIASGMTVGRNWLRGSVVRE
jgi:hypothetical protein